MKHFLLLVVVMALPILNGKAQCVSKPYTPEWDWRGPSQYTFFTYDQNNHPTTMVFDSSWFAVRNHDKNIDVSCSKILKKKLL